MNIDDFDLLSVIGKGSFGKVFVVRVCVGACGERCRAP